MKIVYKKNALIIFILGFFLLFASPVFAERTERIIDNAGILSAAEKESLERLAGSISAVYKFDLIILTDSNIVYDDLRAHAQDYFDSLGPDRDGSILLRVVPRGYWISATGRGISESAFNKLDADVDRFLRRNQPYQAFRAYLLNWEEFLKLDAKGRRFNFVYQWNIIITAIAWLFAFAIGFLVVHSWQRSMSTVFSKKCAADYIIPGSLSFNTKNDRFLYSNVTKVKRQSDSSGSGGGFSVSSSGRSHVGRGGRR
jgi:uncharacterized protein